MPVLAVDPEAVEIGVQITQLCGEMQVLFSGLEQLAGDAAAFSNEATSGAKFLEAFLRGYLGDPLGTHFEMQAIHEQLNTRQQQLAKQGEAIQHKTNLLLTAAQRTRAALTARYGLEFPALQ